MKPVHLGTFLVTLAAVMLVAACTTTPAQVEQVSATNVSVQYQNPKKFTENQRNGFGHGYDHNGYLEKIKTFLIKTASPLLKPDQHLAITITDIDLAGGYEPWRPRMDGVRFMRNMYPPRFDLTFKLTGADGTVIRHGQRKLTDLGYLQDFSPMVGDSDPLRYDKALLARWLRRGPAQW